jgi:hypothetical protein
MIKRIAITVTGRDPSKDASEYGDYVVDSYDSGSYDYSPEEDVSNDDGSVTTYVFYGYDPDTVIEWISETASEFFGGNVSVTSSVDELGKKDHAKLAEKFDLQLPFSPEDG